MTPDIRRHSVFASHRHEHNLALMSADGRGVAQDYVSALMWFDLAAVDGVSNSAKGRDLVAAKMTPAQIAEAQKLAREWKPRRSNSCGKAIASLRQSTVDLDGAKGRRRHMS